MFQFVNATHMQLITWLLDNTRYFVIYIIPDRRGGCLLATDLVE